MFHPNRNRTMFNDTKVLINLIIGKHIHFYSLDSLRIRIPFHLVNILSDQLNKEFHLLSDETGEIVESSKFKKEAVESKEIGFSYYFKIEKIPDHKLGGTNKFVTVLMNAKMLKERYFEGITSENINLVYTGLIDLGIIDISEETFYDARATDIDIKYDSYFKKQPLKANIRQLLTSALSSSKIGKGYKEWIQGEKNVGCEFGRRESSSSANPYFKIYHKETEMRERAKTALFKSAYLDKVNIKDLTRIEFTLKDKKMMNDYGLNSNRLGNILALTQKDFNSVHTIMLSKHFGKIKKSKEKSEVKKTYMEEGLEFFIKRELKRGVTIGQIKDDFTKEHLGREWKNTRHKLFRKFDEIYEEIYEAEIKNNREYEKSEETKRFFQFVGGGNDEFFVGRKLKTLDEKSDKK